MADSRETWLAACHIPQKMRMHSVKQEYSPYPSKEAFSRDAAALTYGIPCCEDTACLASALTIRGKAVKNRLLAQPIEGGDAEDTGAPSVHTFARYTALAQGGSGMIWMESISVNEEGKSTPRQLWLHEETAEQFAGLLRAVHAQGAPFVVAQLTHSGRNSNPDGRHLGICAYENPILKKDAFRIITDEQAEQLVQDYIRAAVLAERAGFDAVDIRACHGYLLNEFLSAYDRPGPYGGSFENRIRLLCSIVDGVRKNTDLTIAVRLNITDGLPYPYGWGCAPDGAEDWSEPLELIGRLHEMGVSILNVSAGIGAYKPYMIRPYDRGMPIPDEPSLKSIERLLQAAKAAKRRVPELCVAASGFTWLRAFAPQVAAGGVREGWFDLAGFGRQWIADPSYAAAILSGQQPAQFCTTCGACMKLLKDGREMQCVQKNNRR